MPIIGNKGEWSELYVLFKILAAGRLLVVGADLSDSGHEYTVVGVSRKFSNGIVAYDLDLEASQVRVSSGDGAASIDLAEVDPAVGVILSKLATSSGVKIEIPEIEALLAKMRVHHLAASGGQKADLEVLVRDNLTTEVIRLPFSIKSQLGSPSTLLNASGATNFRLRLDVKPDALKAMQSLDGKPSKILQAVKASNSGWGTPRPINRVFHRNLLMMDSRMDEVAGALVLGYYLGEGPSVHKIVEWMAKTDPLAVSSLIDPHAFYQYKVKTMLSDFALAVFPAGEWDGKYIASGGYLIVQQSGEVVCLPSRHRDEFREYLFRNTKLETAATGRHGFGTVDIDESGKAFVDLNLQIRFLK